MQILVTGGAGFIGSNLVAYHLNKGDTVCAIDDLSTGCLANIEPFLSNPNFQFTHADLTSCQELDRLLFGVDRVYHMAAVVGVLKVLAATEQVLTVNVNSTERLLSAIKSLPHKPRVLLASTSEVYGEGKSNTFSESCDITIGSGKHSCQSYIISKLATEAYGIAYYQRYQIPITNLRIFNTIGPGQIGGYGMVVPRFIQAASRHQPIQVYGSGQQVRSFCDVRDLVVLMDKIADTPETYGKNINMGHDQAISIAELAKLVKQLADSASVIEYVDYEHVYGQGFEDIMFRKPDLTQLLTYTQHCFQWDLKKTLTDLIRRAPC